METTSDLILAGIVFKPVKGFENYYVSADGAVFSKISNSFRKPVINNKTGYPTLILTCKGTKQRIAKALHRIVAEAWLPNPKNYECINHKNENKLDNHVSNLEWCTKAYNNTYNGKTQRCCKKIIQIDLQTGEDIKVWDSARKAAENLPTNYKNISAVCRGKRRSAGGYGWRFV